MSEELEAMEHIYIILLKFDREAQTRMLTWIDQKLTANQRERESRIGLMPKEDVDAGVFKP